MIYNKLRCIIYDNYKKSWEAYEPTRFKDSIFYFSGAIFNISGLWETKDAYCNLRAITKAIIQRSIANSDKMD